MAIKFIRYVILGLIFLMPFISYITTPFLYGVIWAALLFFLLVAVILLKTKTPTSDNVIISAFCFLLYLIIPTIFSKNPFISAHYLFEFCICVSCFLVFSKVGITLKKKIIFVVILSSFFISLHTIYQHYIGFELIPKFIAENKIILSADDKCTVTAFLKRDRVVSVFANSNLLSIYLVMIILLSLGYIQNSYPSKSSFLTLLILPFNFLAIYFSYSLSGILCLCAGFFIFVLLYIFKTLKALKRYTLKWVGVSVIIFIITTAILAKWKNLAVTVNYSLKLSALSRLNAWEAILSILKGHPFYFLGLGNYVFISRKFVGVLPPLTYSIFVHNIFLQLWIEAGFAGLIIFIWFILSLFIKSLRNLYISKTTNFLQVGLIAAAFTFLLQNMVEFSFFIPQVAIIWWVICGLMVAENKNYV